MAKLEAAFERAMRDKEVCSRIEQLDTQPEFMSSKDLQKWLEGQVRKFEAVIKKANIQRNRRPQEPLMTCTRRAGRGG